jgi:hypothetical protein
MNELRPENISVIDPINPAIDRIKLMLFQPFDLARWFVIGFCAWLANLGHGGTSGPSNFRYQTHQNPHVVKEYIQNNIEWLIPTGMFIIFLGIVIWLVVLWLSSRGKFMFLHCVARNKAEVKVPWSEFSRHATSLFLFRIVVGAILFASVAIPILMTAGFIITSTAVGMQNVTALFGVVMIILYVFVVAIVYLLIKKFTTDFVVPIMFLRTTSCIAAWREFIRILSVNKGRFTLYILFQIAIAIVIGIIIPALLCIGVCCLCGLGLLILIPYIGTVILLPIPMFVRSYSVYYLQQFGLQYDVFRSETENAGVVS